jgi:arsenate reductase
MEKRKPRVLFLCTGNSCRSQMAEGWTRHLWGGRIEAFSAGTIAYGLNADAVRVMAEAGVDISRQQSKSVEEFQGREFDLVVTLCGNAHQRCPVFPGGTKVLHVGFDDPPTLAARARTEDEQITPFRRVRDEIRTFVETLPEVLAKKAL